MGTWQRVLSMVVVVITAGASTAFAQDVNRDRQDLRQDNQDIRQDRRDIGRDRLDLRGDVRDVPAR